jgi:hypothetical protein
VNYFIGEDPSKWRANIPTYQKVAYKNVYDGIDLVYYGNQGHLEYDLIVAPGADPTQIRLAFHGAEQIAVDAQGDLVLSLPQSVSDAAADEATPAVRLHKPVVYQMDEQGGKHFLAGSYVLLAAETAFRPASAGLHASDSPHVAFQVASYDASRPLIIDPVLSWATYLGGSGSDGANKIALDVAGNVYVTGVTDTPGSGFPGTAGSLIQSTLGGGNDAFVTKLNAAGTAIVYSTYLGGSGFDGGGGIAVDQAGNAYVAGFTDGGFPGTAGSLIQSTFGGGGHDAFVAKISGTVPPSCSSAQANPAALWSPNHQFVPIAITGVTDPSGHAVTITVTGVTQDEPVNAKGDGNTSPDAVIQSGAASVRAERSGNGNGRVYQLSFKADNGQGGVCTGAVKVSVPHSMGKGAIAIDDGQVYDSTVR